MWDMWERIQVTIVTLIGVIVFGVVLGSVGWALLAALGIAPDLPGNPDGSW